MANSWDAAKRRRTLAERGLDFADAELVFAGLRVTVADDRRDYGEPRFITAATCVTVSLSWFGRRAARDGTSFQ